MNFRFLLQKLHVTLNNVEVLFVMKYLDHQGLYRPQFRPLPYMADVTSNGCDQTALSCSLIRGFAYRQCLIVCIYMM